MWQDHQKFWQIINTTPSQREISSSHRLVVKLTRKVRQTTKVIQVLQKKLQSYKEKEFEDQILAGNEPFNQACMQINLSSPEKSTAVSTSSSFTTKPTSNNNSYVTPQHNSHRPTPQQVILYPSYGISPSHHRPTGNPTTYAANFHHNYNPSHTTNSTNTTFQRPCPVNTRPVNPYTRTYTHWTGR